MFNVLFIGSIELFIIFICLIFIFIILGSCSFIRMFDRSLLFCLFIIWSILINSASRLFTCVSFRRSLRNDLESLLSLTCAILVFIRFSLVICFSSEQSLSSAYCLTNPYVTLKYNSWFFNSFVQFYQFRNCNVK